MKNLDHLPHRTSRSKKIFRALYSVGKKKHNKNMIFILGHLRKMATMPIYGKIKSLNNKPKLTLTLLRISGERFRSSS